MFGGAFSVAWLYGNTGLTRDFLLFCARHKSDIDDAVKNKRNVAKALFMGMSVNFLFKKCDLEVLKLYFIIQFS
jgi:hypothetical protein